ncbi:MAG: outer membrane protein transport protein [Chlamydiia bacterium]|nr:outer membrane protein transport protein [Chlamydiia bacterium]
MNTKKWIKTTLSVLALATATKAFALNGMYHIGFGPNAKGVGGAAVAFPQDTLTALANPANLVPVGTRADLAVEYLRGSRTAKIRGSTFPFNDVNIDWDLSRNKNIFLAEAGGSYRFCNDWLAVGLMIAPQAGGVITWSIPDPFYPAGTEPFHLDVMYVSITPTFSAKFFQNDWIGKHYVGVGVDLTPARMKVSGLQGLRDQAGFLGGTSDPKHVTNKGWSWTFGWAVRAGYLWEFRPWLSLGVAYRTKTYMGEFERYKGLISPHGRADLPATLYGGISVKPLVQTTIAFDVGRIYNGDVIAFANPPYDLAKGNNHGASNGAGFGWKSTMVYKVGIAQQIADSFTIRGGYNYGQLPWDQDILGTASGALFLPSTIRHHLTLGATMDLGAQMINAAFTYGFKHTYKNGNDSLLGGGVTAISSDLVTFEIGFSKVW